MRHHRGFWKKVAEKLAIEHPASDANPDGYIRIGINRKSTLLHRWVWEQLVGPIPEGYVIDHINGITTDCRLLNLRCIPVKYNTRNTSKRIDNNSGTTGVSKLLDRGMEYWRVSWVDPISGKRNSKKFRISKYGDDEAKRLAIQFREHIFKSLLLQHGYTDRHGS